MIYFHLTSVHDVINSSSLLSVGCHPQLRPPPTGQAGYFPGSLQSRSTHKEVRYRKLRHSNSRLCMKGYYRRRNVLIGEVASLGVEAGTKVYGKSRADITVFDQRRQAGLRDVTRGGLNIHEDPCQVVARAAMTGLHPGLPHVRTRRSSRTA